MKFLFLVELGGDADDGDDVVVVVDVVVVEKIEVIGVISFAFTFAISGDFETSTPCDESLPLKLVKGKVVIVNALHLDTKPKRISSSKRLDIFVVHFDVLVIDSVFLLVVSSCPRVDPWKL